MWRLSTTSGKAWKCTDNWCFILPSRHTNTTAAPSMSQKASFRSSYGIENAKSWICLTTRWRWRMLVWCTPVYLNSCIFLRLWSRCWSSTSKRKKSILRHLVWGLSALRLSWTRSRRKCPTSSVSTYRITVCPLKSWENTWHASNKWRKSRRYNSHTAQLEIAWLGS